MAPRQSPPGARKRLRLSPIDAMIVAQGRLAAARAPKGPRGPAPVPEPPRPLETPMEQAARLKREREDAARREAEAGRRGVKVGETPAEREGARKGARKGETPAERLARLKREAETKRRLQQQRQGSQPGRVK